MEGADRLGGQLRGDEECRLGGVTKSGRVWRKVPESDAGSVAIENCQLTKFLVGAQTVVSLLQATRIISDVYFITDHVAYASSN